MQVFFDEGGHVFLRFGGLQDLDMVGQADVESDHTLDLIDIGVEVQMLFQQIFYFYESSQVCNHYFGESLGHSFGLG